MSIYASWDAPGFDSEDGIVPIVYRGSNIIPSNDDPRGGWVDIASIDSSITRDGRDDGPEDGFWPYLRFGVNEGTVVLDVRGVELVYRALGEWLKRTNGSSTDGRAAGQDLIDEVSDLGWA